MKNFALKTVLFVCLFAGMTATAQTQAKLSHGEILEVRIIDGFDGKNVPQAINAVTDTDIKDPVTRQTIIRRGTPVRIEAKVEKPKGLGREGKIRLNLLSVQAVDGKDIRLSRTVEYTGKKRRGLALGLGIGLPLGTFCLPCFACLAIKGLPAEIPSGELITYVTVQGDYTVTIP